MDEDQNLSNSEKSVDFNIDYWFILFALHVKTLSLAQSIQHQNSNSTFLLLITYNGRKLNRLNKNNVTLNVRI
jgi:hypothetical protein